MKREPTGELSSDAEQAVVFGDDSGSDGEAERRCRGPSLRNAAGIVCPYRRRDALAGVPTAISRNRIGVEAGGHVNVSTGADSSASAALSIRLTITPAEKAGVGANCGQRFGKELESMMPSRRPEKTSRASRTISLTLPGSSLADGSEE